jgi:WD40 repeat protein
MPTTGKEVRTLKGHSDVLWSATFSPDGKRLVTASDDGTVRIWPADPVEAAKRLKPRELTAEESKLYKAGSEAE